MRKSKEQAKIEMNLMRLSPEKYPNLDVLPIEDEVNHDTIKLKQEPNFLEKVFRLSYEALPTDQDGNPALKSVDHSDFPRYATVASNAKFHLVLDEVLSRYDVMPENELDQRNKAFEHI